MVIILLQLMGTTWLSVKRVYMQKEDTEKPVIGISLWDRAFLRISGQLRIVGIVMGSQLVVKPQEMPGIAMVLAYVIASIAC